jgi:hypothetical protein
MITLPENPNIPWLKNTMRELGLNYDRVTDDMCFAEFFKAYPEYVAAAQRLVERSDGARALFACRMFESGAVDEKWADEMITMDTDTHINNVLHFLGKVKNGNEVLENRYNVLSQGIKNEHT